MAFAPDGHTLATASYDRSVRLWDLTDRTRPSPLGAPLTGHTDTVNSVAFAPGKKGTPWPPMPAMMRPCGCGTSPTAPDPARWTRP